MQKILLIAIALFSLSALAATETTKFKLPPPSTESTSRASYNNSPSDLHLVVLTNLDQLAKAQGNVALNVLMNDQAGVSFGYETSSSKEEREKLNKQKLTVDRTIIRVGGAFYVWDVQSSKNLSIVPAMLFRSEKDAVNAENDNGLGVKVAGVFKPSKYFMIEAGLNLAVFGDDATGTAQLGLGLVF